MINVTDNDLRDKLTALAFDVTDNFCYGCYRWSRAIIALAVILTTL